MASQQIIQTNLNFFNTPQPILAERELQTLANTIITQCRINLSTALDDDVKAKLNAIIKQTTNILSQLKGKDSKTNIVNSLNELEQTALTLPTQLEHRSNIASTSYTILKACVFITAAAVAFSIGFVLNAWYFGWGMKTVLDYAVIALADLGIPAFAVGLFAHGLHQATDEPTKNVSDIQDDIIGFGQKVEQIIETFEDIKEEPDLTQAQRL